MFLRCWRWLANRVSPAVPSVPRLARRRLALEPLEDRTLPASLTALSVITGPDVGLGPQVRAFDAQTETQQQSFLAYNQTFQGGVRVARGDFNGDNVPDFVTGSGPSATPNVRIYDGNTLAILANFLAFPSTNRGGVYVATGNFDADAALEVAVGAGQGNPGRVRIFNITGGTGIQITGPLGSFYPYGTKFRGGVRLAGGNFDGQAGDELITAPGPGRTTLVRVYRSTGTILSSFNALGNTFRSGAYVAAGDVNGDGTEEVIVGPDRGGAPRVRVFNGSTATLISNFLVFEAAFVGGVRVGTIDEDGDGKADIIAARGPTGTPEVRIFDGQGLNQLADFFVYAQSFVGGVFVADD